VARQLTLQDFLLFTCHDNVPAAQVHWRSGSAPEHQRGGRYHHR
jgi:hypothetical protein